MGGGPYHGGGGGDQERATRTHIYTWHFQCLCSISHCPILWFYDILIARLEAKLLLGPYGDNAFEAVVWEPDSGGNDHKWLSEGRIRYVAGNKRVDIGKDRFLSTWAQEILKLCPSMFVSPFFEADVAQEAKAVGRGCQDVDESQLIQEVLKKIGCIWLRLNPPPSSSYHPDYYILVGNPYTTCICHCYWVGGISNVYKNPSPSTLENPES